MYLNQFKTANTSLKTLSQENILTVAVPSVLYLCSYNWFISVSTNHFNSNYSISVDRVSIRHATPTPTEYSWMGNSWFPPPGVPYLSPLDLDLLFQNICFKRKTNTLWWSTSWQDYATIIGMINVDNIHNILLVALDHNINRRKYNNQYTPHCHNWNWTPDNLCFDDMGQVTGTEITNYDSLTNANATTNVTSNHPSSYSHTRFGRFDIVRSLSVPCFKGLSSEIRSVATFLQHKYSVIVLSLGIWEASKPKVYQTANKLETTTYLLNKLLDAFELLLGSSLCM